MNKVRLDKLMEYVREKRLTVALFYGKRCPACEDQEKELKELQKNLGKYGVSFVKLRIDKFRKDIKKLPKNDPKRKWSIGVVPTVMMWLKGGINVLYEFEPDGKLYSQINGFVDGDLLYRKIAGLLREY